MTSVEEVESMKAVRGAIRQTTWAYAREAAKNEAQTHRTPDAAAEEDSSKSRRFLQTVIDEIPEALMVIDRHYRVVLANRATRGMAGGRDPVSSRLQCHQVFHGREVPCEEAEHPCPVRQVVSTKAPFSVMHTHCGADGQKVLVEIVAGPILDERGEVFQIVESCRDVTARVRAEDQARQRLAELAHMARLGTMGEMAAGLAHELNQPLAAIVNYIQACLERIRAGIGDPESLLDDLEQAAIQAERAGDVIEHTRAFVRKEKPLPTKVDLDCIVRDAVSLLGSELRQGRIELRLALAGSLPLVEVVPIQIEQVVVNLIQNALEAMRDAKADARLLTIQTTRTGSGAVEFSIRDSGSGFPDDTIEQLFTPFFTTKTEGMGMGLSISRSIIEAHGGRLWAMANTDRGATFRFTLPVDGDCGNEY
jgi:PAS domain S-box-containing protein